MSPPLFRFYLITGLGLCGGSVDELLARAGRFLDALPRGSAAVCVRENEVGDVVLRGIVSGARGVCRRRGAALLVNRRCDVALACGADGVHLGAKTVAIGDARGILPGALVGYSAHDAHEARRAFCRGASFVTVGPVFPSPGKGSPIGLEGLAETVESCGGRPVFSLGGIDASNVGGVFEAGAWGAAFIRAAFDGAPAPRRASLAEALTDVYYQLQRKRFSVKIDSAVEEEI